MTEEYEEFNFDVDDLRSLEEGDLVNVRTFDGENYTGYFLGGTFNHSEGQVESYTLRLTEGEDYDPEEVRQKAENWHDLTMTSQPSNVKLCYRRDPEGYFGVDPQVRSFEVQESFDELEQAAAALDH